MDVEELFNLKGKIALVTGAARGLGREIALALAESGASLVLSDIRNPMDTAAAVEAAGAPWIAVQADISDEVQVKAMAEKAVSKFGRVDILINNAGASQLSYTTTQDLSKAEWDAIIGINLTGTFLC